MARRGRVNILVVYDQSEKSLRWSLSLLAVRLLLIVGAVTVLLALTAVVLAWRTTSQGRRLSELTADNKRLSAYFYEVNQLKEELSLHRDFTRRLCELVGIQFPDSVFGRAAGDAVAMAPEGMDFSAFGQAVVSVDSASLPSELPPAPDNRPQGLPMRGQASRGYAPDENSPSMRHYGLDIAGHEGSPVFATAAGVVEFAGWDEAMGNTIIIDHGTGYKTIYGHNSVIMCEAEQKVNCGEMICLSGNSGRSSAPHLHYEIRFNNQPVDPLGFILTDSTKALAGRSPAP